MGYASKQRILNRTISNGLEALKEMFIILSHQRNANQNDSEIPSYTYQNGQDLKHKCQLMLERVWNKGNIPALLVGVQTYTATLEINMVASQKIGS